MRVLGIEANFISPQSLPLGMRCFSFNLATQMYYCRTYWILIRHYKRWMRAKLLMCTLLRGKHFWTEMDFPICWHLHYKAIKIRNQIMCWVAIYLYTLHACMPVVPSEQIDRTGSVGKWNKLMYKNDDDKSGIKCHCARDDADIAANQFLVKNSTPSLFYCDFTSVSPFNLLPFPMIKHKIQIIDFHLTEHQFNLPQLNLTLFRLRYANSISILHGIDCECVRACVPAYVSA